jgi:hypothetical protein
VIKVFCLIFEPGVAWKKITQARPFFAFVLTVHLLPMILLAHLLNVGLKVSPWTSWLPGLGLVIWILYQGVPQVLSGLYLMGEMDSQHAWLTHKFPGLLQ